MRLSARAYTIPTDAPEADGILAWSSTTLILVDATDDDTVGQGFTRCGGITELLRVASAAAGHGLGCPGQPRRPRHRSHVP